MNNQILTCEDYETPKNKLEGIVRTCTPQDEQEMFYAFIGELAKHYRNCIAHHHKVRTDTIFYSFITHLDLTPDEREEMTRFYKEQRDRK